jgi:hypothetical protein
VEFQAYVPKIHSNNGMLKWNLRIGIQAVFFRLGIQDFINVTTFENYVHLNDLFQSM